MATYFQFEADFVESLRCIPMQVRFKLDTCGIKLKLNQWNRFNQQERESLVDLPCASESEILAYRQFLCELIEKHTGSTATNLPVEPQPAWLEAEVIPDSVLAKGQVAGVAISTEQWAELTPLQRFALLKLSRSGHENHNFLPALQEFQLA
ncbi:nitrate reductase associated protein [Leptolyngbya sp. FACHB-261]|uniref:nitrate reductase associated protein n=1 Tax=Leptolyngbya sp. FACHB-261 TaxID=2692806 RepID=UPI0016870BCA|nr:nitrate reductase associated protein [Leptolyngbya sp. FACHB-261]MBD2104128.1 nitrate reductase associated protein [Leptolyngbya sp. FACHB-261]